VAVVDTVVVEETAAAAVVADTNYLVQI